MNNTILPRGLYPVMLTPFEASGSIDWSALDALVDWYLASGAAGLFAVCLSSEMYDLTPDERLALARRVVDRSRGAAPVVATGTFGGPLEEQAEFTKRMAGTGVAAVVIIPSQLVSPQEGDPLLAERLQRLADLTDPVPLGLYECPSPYKRLLSPELMGWAGRSGRFLYHKDTTCEPAGIHAKLNALRGSTLGLFNAHTPTALDALQHGAAGVSPIAANYYPELFAWLCRRHTGQGDEAREMQRMLTLMEGVASRRYPVTAKLYLQQRCRLPITTRCRIPTEPLAYDDLALLGALWETAERLRRALS